MLRCAAQGGTRSALIFPRRGAAELARLVSAVMGKLGLENGSTCARGRAARGGSTYRRGGVRALAPFCRPGISEHDALLRRGAAARRDSEQKNPALRTIGRAGFSYAVSVQRLRVHTLGGELAEHGGGRDPSSWYVMPNHASSVVGGVNVHRPFGGAYRRPSSAAGTRS